MTLSSSSLTLKSFVSLSLTNTLILSLILDLSFVTSSPDLFLILEISIGSSVASLKVISVNSGFIEKLN